MVNIEYENHSAEEFIIIQVDFERSSPHFSVVLAYWSDPFSKPMSNVNVELCSIHHSKFL